MRKNYEQREGLKKGMGIDKCDSPLGVYLVVASMDILIRSGKPERNVMGWFQSSKVGRYGAVTISACKSLHLTLKVEPGSTIQVTVQALVDFVPGDLVRYVWYSK